MIEVNLKLPYMFWPSGASLVLYAFSLPNPIKDIPLAYSHRNEP
jgi:hypothetical protein